MKHGDCLETSLMLAPGEGLELPGLLDHYEETGSLEKYSRQIIVKVHLTKCTICNFSFQDDMAKMETTTAMTPKSEVFFWGCVENFQYDDSRPRWKT